jgi:hypothetical protein
MHQGDTDIDGAEIDDQMKIPMFDRVIHDPTLQLQRHDFDEEDSNGKNHQASLMPCRRLEDESP